MGVGLVTALFQHLPTLSYNYTTIKVGLTMNDNHKPRLSCTLVQIRSVLVIDPTNLYPVVWIYFYKKRRLHKEK